MWAYDFLSELECIFFVSDLQLVFLFCCRRLVGLACLILLDSIRLKDLTLPLDYLSKPTALAVVYCYFNLFCY